MANHRKYDCETELVPFRIPKCHKKEIVNRIKKILAEYQIKLHVKNLKNL